MSYNDSFFLKKLIDLLSVHLYWKGVDFRYLGCNVSQAKSLGYTSAKEILGKTDYELAPKKIADALRKVDELVAHSGTPIEVEETRLTKNGETLIFLSRKIPLFDSAKKFKGIASISINMSTIQANNQAETKPIQLHAKTSRKTKPKVLLVEDAALAQMITTTHLKQLNCDVDTTETVKNAFQKFKQSFYDIAFIDLSLKDGDAIPLIKSIRSYEFKNKLMATPLIGFTSHASAITKKMCHQAQLTELLKKPILKTQVEDLLTTYLSDYSIKTATLKSRMTSPISGEVINIHQLNRITENNSINPLVNIFPMMLESLKADKPKIQSALKNKNWSALQFLVHKLRGSAIYSAAVRLEKSCGLLEEYLENETPIKQSEAKHLCQQVLHEIEKVQKKISCLLSNKK